MKISSTPMLVMSALLVFLFNLAFTDAMAFTHENSKLDSIESDEYDETFRDKKNVEKLAVQQLYPAPLRRQPLKFGVLGKRYAYGYLGKRANNMDQDFEDWLNFARERRSGRPQYGILG